MNTAIAIIVGAVIYVILMAVLLAVMRMEKTPVDRDEDGAESERDVQHIVQASRPAPLDADDRLDELRTYTTRPHIRAGSAWGKQQ